jgi:hypothetical protein
MGKDTKHIVLCNGADIPAELDTDDQDVITLEYDPQSPDINVNIPLPEFVNSVYHLPDRVKDLVEIAAYVFAADRRTKRGTPQSVEFQSWSRDFHFVIKVRDYQFWQQKSVKNKLEDSLQYMTGDKSYCFTFRKGYSTGKAGFFDEERFTVDPSTPTGVILFSGGLDSLSGIVDRLETTNENVCLVSHVPQSGTGKTQKSLFEALDRDYTDRCKHYKFKCNLKGVTAREETQRTRSLLYSSIAYAVASAYSQSSFYFYENGITSINFLKRKDLLNARASRTTHPKTLGLLEELYSMIDENPFSIKHPFFYKTKTDILELLAKHNREGYINSAVSCSATRMKKPNSTHCGGCSQCVDRRFATYAAQLEVFDGTAIYDLDFIEEKIEDRGMKTTVVDYVRLARDFRKMNYRTFCSEKLSELAELVDYIEGNDEEEKIDKIYNLCVQHGKQIESAISRMYKPFDEIEPGSFLDILSKQEHLKKPIKNLVNTISEKLKKVVPIAFKNNKPQNENDLNDKINAIIEGEKGEYDREFPSISFATAKVIPDHSLNGFDLLIEAKFIRGNTTPSVATEGIAADLTKYPTDSHKLFLVYDPEAQIGDKEKFKKDFEKKGNCTVTVIR